MANPVAIAMAKIAADLANDKRVRIFIASVTVGLVLIILIPLLAVVALFNHNAGYMEDMIEAFKRLDVAIERSRRSMGGTGRTRRSAGYRNVRIIIMDTIKKISIAELCTMTDREGLVLQGCGCDLQEWVDGINDLLTGEGILLDGDKFQNVSTFEYKGSIDLLFDMENVMGQKNS